MKNRRFFLLFSNFFLLFGLSPASSQLLNRQSNSLGQMQMLSDSLFCARTPRKPRPWAAAAEVVGLDAGIHIFDRYIRNTDFAHITLDTIWYNLKHGFIWDNDGLSTNMFW
ncbi:MAG: hypothetical protein FWF53_01170, partial [Candidatus Azobacteroides sp.]|nr:hypothetical protein [Candidatus Azobacteroides sp.]